MNIDWDEMNAGGKMILISVCIAIASMFMNWVDVGIVTRSGISQEAFLLLVFWIYPVHGLLFKKHISLKWGLVCAALSAIATALYMSSKTIEIFGEVYNATAVGAWVLLLASLLLGAGILRYVLDIEKQPEKIQALAIGGSVLFVVALFIPVYRWSREFSYFVFAGYGHWDAILVFVVSFLMVYFSFVQEYKRLYVAFVVSIVCVFYKFFEELSLVMTISDGNAALKKAEVLLGVDSDVPASPEMQIGWLAIFAGLGLIAASAICQRQYTYSKNGVTNKDEKDNGVATECIQGEQDQRNTNLKAKISLVMGIIAILCIAIMISVPTDIVIDTGFPVYAKLAGLIALIGSVMGFITGLMSVSTKQKKYKRMSIAGIIMSGLLLFVFIVAAMQ